MTGLSASCLVVASSIGVRGLEALEVVERRRRDLNSIADEDGDVMVVYESDMSLGRLLNRVLCDARK